MGHYSFDTQCNVAYYHSPKLTMYTCYNGKKNHMQCTLYIVHTIQYSLEGGKDNNDEAKEKYFKLVNEYWFNGAHTRVLH